MSAEAKYDRLHGLQRCDGDGSEGDSFPGVPVLQRSRRLDHKESPFTQKIRAHCSAPSRCSTRLSDSTDATPIGGAKLSLGRRGCYSIPPRACLTTLTHRGGLSAGKL